MIFLQNLLTDYGSDAPNSKVGLCVLLTAQNERQIDAMKALGSAACKDYSVGTDIGERPWPNRVVSAAQ
ncbi:MAG: hypothetical protein EBT71_07925 [Alphaproteobacteria bacterium]|nr:hypothetical protein [Alphaproteobacteria bacterium]